MRVDSAYLEHILYWISSLFINLIVFTLMSLILIVGKNTDTNVETINVFVESFSFKEEKLNIAKGSTMTAKVGQGSSEKGRETRATPLIEAKDKSEDGVSILSEIEKRVKSREKAVISEGASQAKDIGEVSVVLTDKGVGYSSTGGRDIVYVPPMPKIVSDEPVSSVKVSVWVEPSGRISRVEIIQRSGVPSVDREILNFVKNIRFEAINGGVQRGTLTFKFRGG